MTLAGWELLLLKELISVLFEVSTELSVREGLVPSFRLFHARIYSDLSSLKAIVEGLEHPRWDRADKEGAAITTVLKTTEDELFFAETLDDLRESLVDAGATLNPGVQHGAEHYPRLHLFLYIRSESKSQADLRARTDWTCNFLGLEKPGHRVRTAFESALLHCQAALAKYGSVSPDDVQPGKLWRRAELFCTGMRRLYETLSQHHWPCRCPVRHSEARFSFDLPCQVTSGQLQCALYFPGPHLGDHAPRWKPAKIQLDLDEDRQRSRRGRAYPEINHPAGLCNQLESWQDGRFLRLSAETSDVRLSSITDADTTLTESAPPPTSLEQWLASPSFSGIKTSKRITLAVMLSYAFLHFGGDWWPYERDIDTVWFFNTSIPVLTSVLQPFIAFSQLNPSADSPIPSLFWALNPSMPSLVSLGKIIFQLAIGRYTSFDELRNQMESYRKTGHPGILEVVQTCLYDEEFKANDTVRDNERLRQKFSNDVVLKLQRVLQVGYGINVDEVFLSVDATPATIAGPPVSRIPPSQRSQSPDAMLGAIDPSSRISHTGNTLLLYDDEQHGKDMSEDEKKEAKRSEEWKTHYDTKVGECYEFMIKEGMFQMKDYPNDKIVKIAILDTGALIDDDSLGTYECRLQECRNFRSTTSGGLSYVEMRQGEDDDGHGTHATDLLLEMTQHPRCMIYVARVFGSRKDKQSAEGNEEVHHAIKTAIRHAVDCWKTDIITMSFGCSNRVGIIDEQLLYAYSKGVLMFAAASNSAGNDRRSWPARDEKVICIHASNGLGNKYMQNPAPVENQDNFTILGTAVEALWIPQKNGQRQRQCKTGTSSATPIAASLAACIIDIVRRSQEQYLRKKQSRSRPIRDATRDYVEKMSMLSTPRGMSQVFKLMAVEVDRYQYLRPWELLKEPDWWGTDLVGKIFEVLT